MRLRLLLALCYFLHSLPGHAQGKTLLKPFKTDRPPVLDGILDDPVWAQATSVTDFETFHPEFGKKQAEKTVAYMAYDSQNLYFAFRCFDDQANRIKAAVSRRDEVVNDDFVCINLDTFNDQQSLYAFYVNPLGIQGDSRFASNKEDFSVDLVWYSTGRIDAQGYTVEVRIPLKSIRYNQGERVLMSVFFERTINRRQEHGSYPALDPRAGMAFLPQMAPMEYLGLERSTLLEILPAFTYSKKSTRVEGGPLNPTDTREWSLTAKYGITPSLILDATLNPDFSQIEADAGQVDANLRFNLFYAEKRPFFLEGSEAFTIGAIQNSPLQAVLHTRTIMDPKSGLKLSGKIGRDDTVAVLVTDDQMPAPESGLVQAPDAHFSVLRYKRTTWEDGYLGLFYADRDQGGRSNQVMGPDGQIRLSRSGMLSFHAFASSTRPEEGAERVKGRALGLEYLYDTSKLAINAGFHDIDRHFEADAGYLTRTDLVSASLSISPKFYPDLTWLRRVDPLVSHATLKDGPSGLTEGDSTLGLTAILQGNTTVSLLFDDATEVFLGRKFSSDVVTLKGASQVTKTFSFTASYRNGKAIRYADEPFQGKGSQATLSSVYQPTEYLNLTLGWTHADLFRDSTGEKVYDYHIYRSKLTYQLNSYFFLRGIVEYNAFRHQMVTDFLASYTYIPGTVVYLGYGSLYKKQVWEEGVYRPSDRFLEMQRGLFFKASYLWRM